MAPKTPKTPCIGICSTGIGDEVCRGCKRFCHEVIDWNAYSHEQQQLVLDRLEQFIQQIVANKIDIFDEKLLLERMAFQQISIDRRLSSSRWLYNLLRVGASQIGRPEDFGFSIKPEWQRFSLEQIKQFLEQEFYALSCAHYDRYFAHSRL